MAKVTQSSIARRLGVSRQAVGYALGLYTNSNIKLSPETREEIIRTAKELGYRPNRLAQIVSGRKSGLIGVMNFGGFSQFSNQRAYTVARAIQQAGYQVMNYDVSWYEKGGIETVTSALLDNRVEGIVLISPTLWTPPEVLEVIRREHVPMVSLSGVVIDGLPHVESDYAQETYLLTKGLLERGYRSPVFLSRWHTKDAKAFRAMPNLKRLQGFQRAIEEAGGFVDDAPIEPVEGRLHGEIFYSGREANWLDPYIEGELGMRQLLLRKHLPDVVLCLNDDWAAGALKACGRAGIRVPDDIALTGNDNTVISNYGYIPLTTVTQPLEAITQTGIKLLLKMIRKEKILESELHTTIAGSVEWRSSTR